MEMHATMANLTGRIGVRFNWRGKLIVQVQYRTMEYPDIPCVEWKDATIMELVQAMELSEPQPQSREGS
jgi:hypothetical protein